MKKVRVFAPASIANMGCGFDVIGLALDEVGDIIEITESEGDGLSITNLSGVPLPEEPEKNVVTPVIRSLPQKIGKKAVRMSSERRGSGTLRYGGRESGHSSLRQIRKREKDAIGMEPELPEGLKTAMLKEKLFTEMDNDLAALEKII